jgi:hypothetical protein
LYYRGRIMNMLTLKIPEELDNALQAAVLMP